MDHNYIYRLYCLALTSLGLNWPTFKSWVISTNVQNVSLSMANCSRNVQELTNIVVYFVGKYHIYKIKYLRENILFIQNWTLGL